MAFPLKYFVKHKWFKRKMLSFLVAQTKVQTCKAASSAGCVGICYELGHAATHPTARNASTVFLPCPDTIRNREYTKRDMPPPKKERHDPRDQGCSQVQQRSKPPSFWGIPQLPSLSLPKPSTVLARAEGEETRVGRGMASSLPAKRHESNSRECPPACNRLIRP